MRRNLDHFLAAGTVLKEDSIPAACNARADGRITRFFNLDTFFLEPFSVKDPRKIVCNLRVVLEIQVAIFEEVAGEVEFVACANTPVQALACFEICNELFWSAKMFTNRVKIQKI